MDRRRNHNINAISEREAEVLLLIAKGYSNQKIADTLFIVVKTVNQHINNILNKVEVPDGYSKNLS